MTIEQYIQDRIEFLNCPSHYQYGFVTKEERDERTAELKRLLEHLPYLETNTNKRGR